MSVYIHAQVQVHVYLCVCTCVYLYFLHYWFKIHSNTNRQFIYRHLADTALRHDDYFIPLICLGMRSLLIASLSSLLIVLWFCIRPIHAPPFSNCWIMFSSYNKYGLSMNALNINDKKLIISSISVLSFSCLTTVFCQYESVTIIMIIPSPKALGKTSISVSFGRVTIITVATTGEKRSPKYLTVLDFTTLCNILFIF